MPDKSLAEIALELYARDPDGWETEWAIAAFEAAVAGEPPPVPREGYHPGRWANIPRRGLRTMPRMWKIALHWHDHPDVFGEVDLDDVPYCFRCLREVSQAKRATPRDTWNAASRQLDRAHLVDRAADGLDGPQNMVPMCRQCHAVMPLFEAQDADEAVHWVLAGRELLLWVPEEARIKAGIDTRVSDWPRGPYSSLFRTGLSGCKVREAQRRSALSDLLGLDPVALPPRLAVD